MTTVQTTCQVYWADGFTYNITGHDAISAKCDTSYTACTLYDQGSAVLDVTCDSTARFTGSTNPEVEQYICACGSDRVTIPSIWNCADTCYDLSLRQPKCNFLVLYNGFTSGNSDTDVLSDTCGAMDCTPDMLHCSNDGSTEYLCDNEDQQYKLDGVPATHTYVCNCNGAATIPEVYGTGSGKACGNSPTIPSSSSISTHSTTPASSMHTSSHSTTTTSSTHTTSISTTPTSSTSTSSTHSPTPVCGTCTAPNPVPTNSSLRNVGKHKSVVLALLLLGLSVGYVV